MADPIIARELTSLRDAMTQRMRASTGNAETATAQTDTRKNSVSHGNADTASSETEMEKQLHALFGDLVDEITGFLEEAEKNIAAHPAASMVGALVVGVLIGSMIRRR